jgi:hypothetical protein
MSRANYAEHSPALEANFCSAATIIPAVYVTPTIVTLFAIARHCPHHKTDHSYPVSNYTGETDPWAGLAGIWVVKEQLQSDLTPAIGGWKISFTSAAYPRSWSLQELVWMLWRKDKTFGPAGIDPRILGHPISVQNPFHYHVSTSSVWSLSFTFLDHKFECFALSSHACCILRLR